MIATQQLGTLASFGNLLAYLQHHRITFILDATGILQALDEQLVEQGLDLS
ncbi:hypothetical protein D3C78_1884450 [compost metagenome]